MLAKPGLRAIEPRWQPRGCERRQVLFRRNVNKLFLQLSLIADCNYHAAHRHSARLLSIKMQLQLFPNGRDADLMARATECRRTLRRAARARTRPKQLKEEPSWNLDECMRRRASHDRSR